LAEALDQEGADAGASQAALVAMTPEGAVVAMVGGRDYAKSPFNRAATAMRQPGSAFKLFVYYAALKTGLTPFDRVDDAPIDVNDWSPENYGGGYRDRVSMAEAFARSLNAATVALAMEVGIDKVIAAARELGIDARLAETPSLALGSSEVNLLDLTGAYASVRAGSAPIELNPIRMRPGREGRLTPVACDFKCGFDRDDPRWQRLGLPDHVFTADASEFEQEVNQLRTHQGQSDVFVINDQGTILAPTFGGGANSLVTEVLGEAAIISSDFGGNPPYEKMKEVARICYKHWLSQANVLFLIGGKSNNTDIYETFRAMGDALREHFSQYGPTPLFVVVGRGGPNLVRGLGALAETCDSLGLPYRFFGFDSAISEVVNYARKVDAWMQAGGRGEVAKLLGIKSPT
jgi:hypothetical protein